KLWGLDPARAPRSSFTIGLDTPEKMRQKVAEASAYPILKIKLGTERDEQILRAIRDVTDKPLRVDANAGWTRDRALQTLPIWTARRSPRTIPSLAPRSTVGRSAFPRGRGWASAGGDCSAFRRSRAPAPSPASVHLPGSPGAERPRGAGGARRRSGTTPPGRG